MIPASENQHDFHSQWNHGQTVKFCRQLHEFNCDK